MSMQVVELSQKLWLTTREAAIYSNRSRGWFEKRRETGCQLPGPPWKRIGAAVLYNREALDAWLDAQPGGGGEA